MKPNVAVYVATLVFPSKQTKIEERFMRIIALAITGLVAVGVADPAFAAKKKPMANSHVSLRGDFDKCEAQSIQLGAPPGQSGHREWMMHCLYGVVTGRQTNN